MSGKLHVCEQAARVSATASLISSERTCALLRLLIETALTDGVEALLVCGSGVWRGFAGLTESVADLGRRIGATRLACLGWVCSLTDVLH
jgi:hypothetical protein